jgi:aspartate 1-decarboxylase
VDQAPVVTVPAPVDQAPIVTAQNQWMMRHQSIAASSLFTATDPDGDTITTYALNDPTGKGYFVVNGVVQASNTEIDLTAAQLAQTIYQSDSGSGGWGVEQLSIRASDGALWSAWQTATVTVVAPNEKAPIVTSSDLTTLAGQTFAASSLFAVSDFNGDPIVTYALKDVTGSGHFVVNGVAQASNTEIDLTAAQLAQTTFVAGSGTDQLSIRASDGFLWGKWQSFTANVSPTPVIDDGATLELASAYLGTVTFASTTGTLKLDNSTSFSGTVAGLAGQDTLDLADINFATIQNPTFNGTNTGGVLTVTDGSHTANIVLLGDYTASTFNVSSDGQGGTFVADPPATSPVPSPSDPAAPVTNADQPVVTSPEMGTVSMETGASLPPPSISSTTKDNAGLLSEVQCTTDCEDAQSENLQGHDAAITSPPIDSKSYAIAPPFLSLSFDSGRVIAASEIAVAIPSDDAQHNVIALLSQFTAAGFHVSSDAGAMVSSTTTASTSEATLALFTPPVSLTRD